jgi:hypothetical protein
MFGLNLYAIMAVGAIILFCGGFVNGCSYQQSKAEKVVREKEHEYQTSTDRIRKDKDEKINNINNQLADAISELRKRPSRSSETLDGSAPKGCNGSQLYSEDAEFLIRESARAEKVRVALLSCYQQYDEVGK